MEKKSGTRGGGGTVVRFQNGELPQTLLRQFVAAENQTDAAVEHQAKLAEQIRSLLLAGARVEPGTHTARLETKFKRQGKKLVVKLRVK